MSSPGFPILAPPRITRAGFRAILRRHRSPATLDADACYAAIARHGVDPAVGLAIFKHESGYGRAGIATRNRSWGNIRTPGGAFRKYATWTAGADDMGRLLAIYGHNAIRPGQDTNDTRTFAYVWAPSEDHNDPAGYGADVTALVAAWSALYPTSSRPPDAAGRVMATRLRRLWRSRAGELHPIDSATAFRFTAWATAPVRKRTSTGGGGPFTFRKLLTGAHHGMYVHVSDRGQSFTEG